MKKLQVQVAEFHTMAGAPVASLPTMIDRDRKRLRLALILEETQELAESLGCDRQTALEFEALRAIVSCDKFQGEEDIVAAADALADTDYVLTGTAVEMGIDLQACTDEVHASNMTKSPSEKAPSGKVCKGATYRPPNIAAVLARCSSDKCGDSNPTGGV